MFARIATGWELTKQSFGVLRQDKELVLFPILSGVACSLVLASFVLPLWGTPMFDDVFNERQAPQNPLAYVVMFAFYFVNYFVILFFNVALVSCAVKRMAGGNPTIGYGLQQAASRIHQIAAWALVSATVGMILKAIESRSQWLGKLVTSFIGAGWAIATYFVVPVLVVEQVGHLARRRCDHGGRSRRKHGRPCNPGHCRHRCGRRVGCWRVARFNDLTVDLADGALSICLRGQSAEPIRSGVVEECVWEEVR
jgi:hypothetical protein